MKLPALGQPFLSILSDCTVSFDKASKHKKNSEAFLPVLLLLLLGVEPLGDAEELLPLRHPPVACGLRVCAQRRSSMALVLGPA